MRSQNLPNGALGRVVMVIFAVGGFVACAAVEEPTGRSGGASAEVGLSVSFHVDAFKGESYSLKIEGSEVLYRSGPYYVELEMPWRRVRVPVECLRWFERYLEDIGVFGWKEQ